jgi:16S rRNA (guanine527-N7)-methyltransferase
LDNNLERLTQGAIELGLEITPAQITLFQKYFEELIDWNTRINLTGITGYEEVQEKHFLDSLTVSSALPRPIPEGFRLIDVGSGGGFPGVPLKIMCPQIEMVLLEATGKKANFLSHLVKILSLENVQVINARAEDLAQSVDYREHFDAATARALAEMSALSELTLPFCRIGGRMVALKKGEMAEEIAASAEAICVLGGGRPEVQKVHLSSFTDDRCLVIVNKMSATPSRFPRRPGMPSKHPLS